MFIITNPKVAGFVPKWSQFKGFSISAFDLQQSGTFM